MPIVRPLLATLLLLTGLVIAMPTAHAAESYDNCTGFIDSVPATISTQGVWCLRKDLSTAITSGDAITIATNNVTIDCNDFKLGGLAAGAATFTFGIQATDRHNATVRHCNIRGFIFGVLFQGDSGSGHVVEDNRFNNNTSTGVYVAGDGSVVRRNLVTDTGGSTSGPGYAYGILTIHSVDILDNTISGVLAFPDGGDGYAFGISTVSNANGSIKDNRIRGLVQIGNGALIGIDNSSSGRISMEGNHVIGDGSVFGFGLYCTNEDSRAKDNIINGFAVGINSCGDAGGNDFY